MYHQRWNNLDSSQRLLPAHGDADYATVAAGAVAARRRAPHEILAFVSPVNYITGTTRGDELHGRYGLNYRDSAPPGASIVSVRTDPSSVSCRRAMRAGTSRPSTPHADGAPSGPRRRFRRRGTTTSRPRQPTTAARCSSRPASPGAGDWAVPAVAPVRRP
ncbi:hypothetical protein ZWY2020_029700 [Hordeum vulgare]|nr:hypothetical protein ZWY2020_029700 [Hordeum vulgare]